MDCTYQAYFDNGIELKKLISDYQEKLIEEKVLLDGTAKSYLNLFQEIASKEIKHLPIQPFFEKFQNIDYQNQVLIKDCRTKLLKDSTKYANTKLQMLDHEISLIRSGSFEPSLIAQKFLSVLNLEDLELDYYQLRAMMLFEVLNTNLGIKYNLRTPTGQVINNTPEKALKISIKYKGQFYVNNQKVRREILKDKVKKYVDENKGKSVIIIDASRETMYRTYRDVQSVITSAIKRLRENFAINEYKAELELLTDEQRERIRMIYPIKIIETKPN